MINGLGILIATCDADEKHFDRLMRELTRLDCPFAINFDHCCDATKRFFEQSKLFIGARYDDDQNSKFDESFRQYPLNILVDKKFEWACYFDTDEVFDRRAPEMIPQLLKINTDLIWCPVLDFWGDDKHYRTDGPFGPAMDPTQKDAGSKQLRKKFYNLRAGRWKYLHPHIHSPALLRHGRVVPDIIHTRSNLYVLHYGIMNQEDVKVHTERWKTVYTRKMGYHPWPALYEYLNDPNTVPTLEPFDYDTFEGQ